MQGAWQYMVVYPSYIPTGFSEWSMIFNMLMFPEGTLLSTSALIAMNIFPTSVDSSLPDDPSSASQRKLANVHRI